VFGELILNVLVNEKVIMGKLECRCCIVVDESRRIVAIEPPRKVLDLMCFLSRFGMLIPGLK